MFPLLLVFDVPDLNLWVGSKVDPTIGFGSRFVIDPEFKIAELTISGEVNPLPVVDDFAVVG